MGPPKTKNNARGQQPRGRFYEGSMNDRTSAAPPVQFLGPEERAALEQSVEMEAAIGAKHGRVTRKTGTGLFGQVWEGVRERLRLRKDQEDDGLFSAWTAGLHNNIGDERPQTSHGDAVGNVSSRRKKAAKKKGSVADIANSASQIPPNSRNPSTTSSEFPSADDILASYHQLVSQGFFKSNAIHSTRVPAPGPPPRVPPPPAPSQQQRDRLPRNRPSSSHDTRTAPAWPLSHTPVTPTVVRVPSAIRSPASASSRGTKRAAADDSSGEDNEDDGNNDEQMADTNDAAPRPANMHRNVSNASSTVRESGVPKRKLRKVTSSDIVVMPRVRGSTNSAISNSSRRLAGGRRSVSASNSQPNKLTKRAPTPMRPPGLVDVSSISSSINNRSLRSMRSMDVDAARPLSVVPDANRGIPSVPVIPPKFTFGEDRENNGPWRGLRIR